MDTLSAVPPAELYLTPEQWDQMRQEVSNKAPEEACGLVAGKKGRALQVIPVTNKLHSRVRFRMEPAEQLDGLMRIDDNGWELVAIYHSHPQGPDHPSPTDITEAAYPEAVNLIWSKQTGEWQCRGYRIMPGSFQEIPVILIASYDAE